MNKFFGLFKVEFLKLMRTPVILFFGFIAPQFFLWMQSTNFSEITLEGKKVATVDYSFPMYVFLTILVIGVGNVGVGMSYNRLIRFFKRLKLSGVSTFDFIIANFLLQLFVVTISVVSLLLTAIYILDMNLNGKAIFSMIGVFFVVWCMVYLLGMIFANLTKDAKTSQSVALVSYFFLIFISGATYPVELMPEILQKISKVLPTYPALSLLKDTWINGSASAVDFAVVLTFTVVFLFIAIKIFKYD
ncbi:MULTISPECIES: ABC transporter permease [unclassified Streptococcus]|uniref:ABC transporter permease n=1 Tax=unclassified Streptococcus TaxID=2608887 RepID=UPI00359DE779